MTNQGFGVLLIEDNDGDAKLIRKYLEKVDESFLPRNTTLQREPNLSEGLEALEKGEFDLLLLDLGLPESSGIDTLYRVLEDYEDVPVVVLTGLDHRETAVQAVQEGAQDYLSKDTIDVEELGRTVRYAVERKKRRQKSERQEELRRTVQEILVTSSARDEIEQKFCDALVLQEPYVFAWIGNPDAEEGVLSRASSGDSDGYLETMNTDECSDREKSEPSVRTARSHEPTFVPNVEDASEIWGKEALERGFASVASVPLTYKEISYGVLSVYSDEPNFFGEIERQVLESISDTLSYSINTASKESALSSESFIEVRIRTYEMADYFDGILELADSENQVTVEVTGTVPTKEGSLQFVEITDIPPEVNIESRVISPRVEDVERMYTGDSGSLYKFTFSEPTPESYLIDMGVVVQSSTVTDQSTDIQAEVPSSRDLNKIIQEMESVFGPVDVMVCKDIVGDRYDRTVLFNLDALTDKQEQALRTAYHLGYFEQPKKTSSEEIAEALGVSRSTFIQHLRTAQRKTFGDIFG